MRLFKKAIMKTLLSLLFLTFALTCSAQSRSYEILKEKFNGNGAVSFNVGGLFFRTALWIAGERELRRELGEIRNVRFINIPQHALRAKNLKLTGFKKILLKDNFEQMASVSESGEVITVYMKDDMKKRSNLYFVLIENRDEVIALEIKGRIDTNKLLEDHNKKKLTSL